MAEPAAPSLAQDMHVHSTFTDGKNTIAENVEEAEELGLTELTCVDHVRVDSDWLDSYVAEVERMRGETEITLLCGIEAKLLDAAGTLDLPPRLPAGVDRIYAADHQVPLGDGHAHPRDVKARLESGELGSDEVFDDLIDATIGAAGRYDDVVIAHLFSILPKIGLAEEQVPEASLERLARGVHDGGGRIEISERWSCPSARSLAPFIDAGVEVLISTDAHMRSKIGRYEHCVAVLEKLGVEPRGRERRPPA